MQLFRQFFYSNTLHAVFRAKNIHKQCKGSVYNTELCTDLRIYTTAVVLCCNVICCNVFFQANNCTEQDKDLC